MNKRIIITESERQSILSQHKKSIQNESEIKKQSLSERELSKVVNKALIQENSQINERIKCRPFETECGGFCCPRNWECVDGQCRPENLGTRRPSNEEVEYDEMDEETDKKRCRFYNRRGKCVWDVINPFNEEVDTFAFSYKQLITTKYLLVKIR